MAALGKAKYYITLDLKGGYWQIPLNEEDKEKTAFTCHRGLYEYNVMPFGLAGTPGMFQELMSVVLHGLGNFTMAYLDDIIFSASEEEHKQHIQIVFDCLRQYNLKLKLSKCKFMQKETQYLGFIISEDGIMTDPDKIKGTRQMLPPTCVREVRSFICMCSYYRRFIPNFSAIAKPLIRLTKKFAKFDWSKECQAAFEFPKDSLTTVLALAYQDTSKPYILYTNASDDCTGTYLCPKQDTQGEMKPNKPHENPIHYLSHKLIASQTNWPKIEKEAFAIFYALQKLDQYLHNSVFVIRTDHKPLRYITDSPVQNKNIPWLQL